MLARATNSHLRVRSLVRGERRGSIVGKLIRAVPTSHSRRVTCASAAAAGSK